GRFNLTHRYRLEQRWLGRRGDDTTDHTIEKWLRASRFRYQVRGTMPLRGPSIDDREPYLYGYDEVMIGFGKGVAMNVFDQNRATLGVGWRYDKSWRVETGFLEQLLLKPNGHDLEKNNTITLGAYYTRAK